MRSAQRPIPMAIASAIVADMLRGLHAAHTATAEDGTPLRLVHRDVSPQNLLVGVDGVARVVDFGVAKAVGRGRTTRDGSVRGKLGYMAPEQLAGESVTPAVDIYAAGVVLWELLTGERLFAGDVAEHVIERVMLGVVKPPSARRAEVPSSLDDVVLTSVDSDPSRRFRSAGDMAVALETAIPPAGRVAVGEWVKEIAHDVLANRAARIVAIESADAPAPSIRPRAPARRSAMLVAGVLTFVGVSFAVASVRPTPAPRVRDAPASSTDTDSSRTTPDDRDPDRGDAPTADDPQSVGGTTAVPAVNPNASPGVRHTPAPRRPVVGTGAPARGCDPPFRLETDGRKIYKRQCL
jgi:serine/threonine-protein kinase